MEKQKICIIGGGLTGIITALSLSKLNLDIDLIAENINKNIPSSRTLAISQDNLDFLKNMNSLEFNENKFWPCEKIELYTNFNKNKFSQIFNLEEKEKSVLYVAEDFKLKKFLIEKIKTKKSITIRDNESIFEIVPSGSLKKVKFKNNESKYNLILLCTGNDSDLVRKSFNDRSLEHSYEEISITTILNHEKLKNNVARQIFLDDEILALLPISNEKTSIVWTVKKNFKTKNNSILKKKIKFYTKNFLKNIKFKNKINFFHLNFLTRKKYFKDRMLLFGNALHAIHPLAGQGFNMTLRDLKSLEKTLSDKINLGLDIGSVDILSQFSDEVKPRNFAFSITIDLLRNYFNFNNKPFKNLRNEILINLNKSNIAKKIIYNFANKGI